MLRKGGGCRLQNAIEQIALSPEWVVRIAQSLAGLVDLRDAVTAMSEELQALVPHDHIDVALLSEFGETLIVYETGLETSWGNKLCSIDVSPIRDVLYGQVDHMIFKDAVKDDRVQFRGADSGPIRTFGLRSRLHHKIEISGVTVGALSVSSLRPHVYSTNHLSVIRTVANVVGPYFHALRTSELAQSRAIELERQEIRRNEAEHLVEIQEQERNRIGMDLHDHILADMSRLLRSLDDEGISKTERLRDARLGLTSAIQDVRDIVEDARPTLLEMFGLGTAIEAYLQKSIKGSSVQVHMETAPEDIDRLLGIHHRDKLLIFRIVQEAINNAIQHAQAEQVVVRVNHTGPQIIFVVEDNGVGLNLAPGARQSGLKNMNARATMIGATLQISALTPGTKITLCLNDRAEVT